MFITARKRCLGQGSVFIPVCDSVQGGCIPACNGADTLPARHLPWADNPSDTTGYGQQAGGTHPTGMHTCFRFCLTINFNII